MISTVRLALASVPLILLSLRNLMNCYSNFLVYSFTTKFTIPFWRKYFFKTLAIAKSNPAVEFIFVHDICVAEVYQKIQNTFSFSFFYAFLPGKVHQSYNKYMSLISSVGLDSDFIKSICKLNSNYIWRPSNVYSKVFYFISQSCLIFLNLGLYFWNSLPSLINETYLLNAQEF